MGSAAIELEDCDPPNEARWGNQAPISEAVAALTSSNALKSHTGTSERTQRGLKGITPWGQQMLRSACFLMEQKYGNRDLAFVTMTVPTLPRESRVRLAENWSELVRQLLQWVCRKLMQQGRPTKVCGCTEIQSRRLEASGEAYLHLHLVWPAHSNSGDRRWAVEWGEVRDWWESALERFAGCELPHHPRVETALVKKSAERYMGKYLSKGSGEALDEFVSDLGADSVPPAWWFMTADLRSWVKDEMAHGPNTGEILQSVVNTALEDGELSCFEWIRPVMIDFGSGSVHVGWCGRLRANLREDLKALLDPVVNSKG